MVRTAHSLHASKIRGVGACATERSSERMPCCTAVLCLLVQGASSQRSNGRLARAIATLGSSAKAPRSRSSMDRARGAAVAKSPQAWRQPSKRLASPSSCWAACWKTNAGTAHHGGMPAASPDVCPLPMPSTAPPSALSWLPSPEAGSPETEPSSMSAGDWPRISSTVAPSARPTVGSGSATPSTTLLRRIFSPKISSNRK
mmetsp:Transcript_14514/g.44402  ORF Transcript_14514/g.44402 Transcript_14514/m.44402 type:complete len:201 (+) Transcript_14514:139-741(+)